MNENLIRPSNSNANQLQDTVNSYRALIAASGIGAWEYDINTGYLNCNDIYFAMLGITVEGHSAKHDLENAWINLLHPDDSVAAQEKFRDFIEGKNLENYENFFRLKSNLKEWIWIWSRGKILKDSHGKPERAIGTHLDVTAQK
ncbi:MAG: PAS domain-containing protein [Bacteroidota bacterium]|nr:PAS domain-containing protein [Bacteroidota bacterium]